MSNETEFLPRQYVLDTNVLISDPHCLFKFDEHDIIIPMTVIEELDNLKSSLKSDRQGVSRDARIASQNIKKIANGHGSQLATNGVSIGEGAGVLKVFNDNKVKSDELAGDINDNKIIMAALALQKEFEGKKKTILVTKDTNCLLKAFGAGLERVEDYENDHQIKDIDYLSKGYFTLPSDFMETLSDVDAKYQKGAIYTLQKSDLPEELLSDLYLNQYLLIENTDHLFCVKEIRESEIEAEMLSFQSLRKLEAFGVTPRNDGQALALSALLDPNIDMVQLVGPAGSGKTLLAVAAAIHQSRFQTGGRRHDVLYDKIILTRNTPDMAEAIGFLPGTEEEKMMPWLAAFTDTLDVLASPSNLEGNTEDKLDAEQSSAYSMSFLKEKSNMQFKSLNFMRGRSIQRGFVILDESQNLTPHQMKSVITRMGEGTKLVVLGNLGQIDAKYVTPLTSGLTHSVIKMKGYGRSVVVDLPGGERSELSSFAEENL
tara:strand:+ start:4765 stop:6222 length:1458 start_codon:yes stop_codon:yes gene_type:complete